MKYTVTAVSEYLDAVGELAAEYAARVVDDPQAQADETLPWEPVNETRDALGLSPVVPRGVGEVDPKDPNLERPRSGPAHALARALLGEDFLSGLPFRQQLVASLEDPRMCLHVFYGLSAIWRLRDAAGGEGDPTLAGMLVPPSDANAGPDDPTLTGTAAVRPVGATELASLQQAFSDYVGGGDARTGGTRADRDQPPYGSVVRRLPMMVLYHDIGKSQGPENHAAKGAAILRAASRDVERLVEYPEPPPAATLELERAAAEDRDFLYDLLLGFVRYHDLWGNVGTGEAGLPLLTQALNPTESRRAYHLLVLMSMLAANLCDLYAPFRANYAQAPSRIDGASLGRIKAEWDFVKHSFVPGAAPSGPPDSPVQLADLWEGFCTHGRAAGDAIERLYMLIREAGVPGVQKVDVTRAYRALSAPTELSFDFATVRLAYAKQFVEAMRDAIVQNARDEIAAEELARDETAAEELARAETAAKEFAKENVPDRICEIVAELCQQYRSQIRAYAEKQTVTVMELSPLRPAGYPQPEDASDPKPHSTKNDAEAIAKERFTKMLIDDMWDRSRGIWLPPILEFVSIRPGR